MREGVRQGKQACASWAQLERHSQLVIHTAQSRLKTFQLVLRGRTLQQLRGPGPSGYHATGAAVRCSTSDDPKRKLRHTLEMIRVGRTWVGLHTGRANAVAARALSRPLCEGAPRAP